MPDKANKALVFIFVSSQMKGAPDTKFTTGNTRAYRAYTRHRFVLEDAVFTTGAGSKEVLNIAHRHNMTFVINAQALENREASIPSTKLNQIEFDQGKEITIKYDYIVNRSGDVQLTAGGAQILLIPFRDVDGDNDGSGYSVPAKTPGVVREGPDIILYNMDDGEPDIYPPADPNEVLKEQGDSLREEIDSEIQRINSELHYVEGTTTGDTLIEYRDQLRNARFMPGPPEDVKAYVDDIFEAVDTILDYSFPFE